MTVNIAVSCKTNVTNDCQNAVLGNPEQCVPGREMSETWVKQYQQKDGAKEDGGKDTAKDFML